MTEEELLLTQGHDEGVENASPHEDTDGNFYASLWTFADRQQSGVEVLAKHGGLMKGRIDWVGNPKLDKTKSIQLFHLKYLNEGALDSALFTSIEELAQFLNNGIPLTIRKELDKYTFEFDSTKKWSDSGAIEVGYHYVHNHGWRHEKHAPSGNLEFELDDDETMRDIELLILDAKETKIGIATYRRDLPIVNPRTFIQYISYANVDVSMQISEANHMMLKVTRGDKQFGDVYWRYLDK